MVKRFSRHDRTDYSPLPQENPITPEAKEKFLGELDKYIDQIKPPAKPVNTKALGIGNTIEVAPTEKVNHPAHYNKGKIEVIDFIEDQALGFNLGNAVKYVARAEHKGNALEDLKKARWYLDREIARREKKCSG